MRNVILRFGGGMIWSGLMWGCATSPAPTPVSDRSGEDIVQVIQKVESLPRADVPPSVEELPYFFLVLRTSPEGHEEVRWYRADGGAFQEELRVSRRRQLEGTPIPAVMQPRDCIAEFEDRVNQCMRTPLPPGLGHVNSNPGGKGRKWEYCRGQFWQTYRDCEEAQGRQPQEFSAVNEAMEWLMRNRQALVVGSLVTIAGVAFITVSVGTGAVILAPVVLAVLP